MLNAGLFILFSRNKMGVRTFKVYKKILHDTVNENQLHNHTLTHLLGEYIKRSQRVH